MVNKVIGIDPGATGAFAIRHGNGVNIFRHIKGTALPSKEIFPELGGVDSVYMEKVHYITGQGGVSAFSFGRNAGKLDGLLFAFNLEAIFVQPTTWQKELGLVGPYYNKQLRKQAHIQKAYELFPEYREWVYAHSSKSRNKAALDTADAVLIAEYGYRKEKQKEEYHGI